MTFKILVVEDEADYREVLVDYLRLKGYAADGIDSIKSYGDIPAPEYYDLIVLDRTLPDGDGLFILEAYRKVSANPVVILSGLGALEDRIKGLDADANYYLVKPVKTAELLAIIGLYARKATAESAMLPFWSINPRQWQLKSPDGSAIKLTNLEMIFLSCFEKAEGVCIKREGIISKLGSRPEVYDIRRLEAMVRRIRVKMKDAGIDEFPLATVYGVGYAFNAELVVTDTTN